MIPFLADIDLAFKLLAPRPADWPTILPELAVAGLAAEGARAEGRAFYTVAVGCTGGRHRSVAVAERLAEELSGRFAVEVVHRDVEREG